MLYFQKASLVAEAFADRGERTAFLCNSGYGSQFIDHCVFQVYLTARIIKMAGCGAHIGRNTCRNGGRVCAARACFQPLTVLIVIEVMYRAGRYGLTKPAREILWTVLGREAKYKSKPFLDAAVYRGGDLLSGWIYTPAWPPLDCRLARSH